MRGAIPDCSIQELPARFLLAAGAASGASPRVEPRYLATFSAAIFRFIP